MRCPHGRAHTKVCVVDDQLVAYGSFNWSKKELGGSREVTTHLECGYELYEAHGFTADQRVTPLR